MTSTQGVKYFVAGDSAVPSWWSLCSLVFRERPVLHQVFMRLIEVGWISAAGPNSARELVHASRPHLDSDEPIVPRFSPGMGRCTAGPGTDVSHQTDPG